MSPSAMRVNAVVILTFLSAAASGQTPAAAERFYQAIRQDDMPALRTLVRDEGVNGKDAARANAAHARRGAEPKAHLHVLCRTTEPDDADVDAAVHAPN